MPIDQIPNMTTVHESVGCTGFQLKAALETLGHSHDTSSGYLPVQHSAVGIPNRLLLS